MKTILVATDFSPAAINATHYAADMAIAINADIYLLHVFQMPHNYGEIPVPIDTEAMMQDAVGQLAEIKDQLTKKTGSTLHINGEVRMGTFYHELKDVCEDIQPYAVIMGSQGTSAAQHFLFGSNSVYAVKHLPYSIIAVPAHVQFSSIKKIGLACDFDNVSESIELDEIKSLVNDFNATLFVLNTGKKNEFSPELIFESQLLHRMLKPLHPSYYFITSNDNDQGIADFADQHQLDLLIIVPKKHDILEKIFHASHTKQLVLHSQVPVMALHQKQ